MAALAVSAAAHALLVGALGAPFGARWGEISWFEPSLPIRAVLRPGVLAARDSTGGEEASAGPLPPAETAEPRRALLPEPRYYLTRELDGLPAPLAQIEPEYPAAAAERNLSGRVVIRLFIDESGAVERVVTLRADPPGVFEQSAERAFLAARFTPGIKKGAPVKVQMTIEVSFDSPPAAPEGG